MNWRKNDWLSTKNNLREDYYPLSHKFEREKYKEPTLAGKAVLLLALLLPLP